MNINIKLIVLFISLIISGTILTFLEYITFNENVKIHHLKNYSKVDFDNQYCETSKIYNINDNSSNFFFFNEKYIKFAEFDNYFKLLIE